MKRDEAAWCVYCDEEVSVPHHCPQVVRAGDGMRANSQPWSGQTANTLNPHVILRRDGKRSVPLRSEE